MAESEVRGAPTSLRGRLSEVYFPALVAARSEALANRLGKRATIDDPLFGRSNGPSELARSLAEMESWLAAHDAAFEDFGAVTGSDRDVAEGTLALSIGGQRMRVPVGLVAERGRERAVDLRAYYATDRLREAPTSRRELFLRGDKGDRIAVPPPVAAHIEACARGDVAAAVASFERGGTVRDAAGRTHAKLDTDGGPLGAYHELLLSEGGTVVIPNARADDGRACALEYTVLRMGGREIAPRPGLAVYERGDSGLLRTLRIYGDVGF